MDAGRWTDVPTPAHLSQKNVHVPDLLPCRPPHLHLLPIEVNSSALARAVAGLQEWKEFLIALIAGCAIALGAVFMSRKKEEL